LSCNKESDRRPQFLFFRDFSGMTEEEVLENLYHSLKKLIQLIIHLETTCVSVKVVVGTQARQAKILDSKFTWQPESFTQNIDEKLKHYIKIHYSRIFVLDTHMLTYDQPTYDGSHLLTKTNLELTNCILQTIVQI
jgi:hypothetical protein